MAALVKASLYAVVYCIKAGKDASKRTYQAFKQLLKSDEQALYNSDREALAAIERHIDEKTFNAIANAQQAGDIAVADVYASLLSKLGKPDVIEKVLLRLPKEQLSDLIKDLDNADFARLLTQKPEVVEAWKRLADLGRNQMRKDPSILASMYKAINNADIPSNRLDDIINSLAGSGTRCKTCDNAGNEGLRYIDEVLDDLDGFAKEFKNTSGYNDFLGEMGRSRTTSIGSSWTLEVLMRNRSKYFRGKRSQVLRLSMCQDVILRPM